MHSHVVAALFPTAKIWKQPKCLSVDEWIKMTWYIYIYNGILFSHKKEENPPFARTSMDLEDIRLSEISQRKTTTL